VSNPGHIPINADTIGLFFVRAADYQCNQLVILYKEQGVIKLRIREYIFDREPKVKWYRAEAKTRDVKQEISTVQFYLNTVGMRWAVLADVPCEVSELIMENNDVMDFLKRFKKLDWFEHRETTSHTIH
jgi:hypothetical protein